LLIVVFVVTVGCDTQRVEYRNRPFWQQSMANQLPSEGVRDDGTVMKFSTDSSSTTDTVVDYLNTVKLEEKDELTGEITLRAVLPEHLLSQTLTCLRDRDWVLLFEQVLSEQIQSYYNQREFGYEEFEDFFSTNRRDLAMTFQRMIQGRSIGDVIENQKGNKLFLTFSRRVKTKYKFNQITLVRQGEYLKLYSIE
jgi:hypothetical protein